MAKITFENVTKVYQGNVTAVKDLNLTIDDQEFIVLLGPSGCGKTTILRMLCGLENVTSGNIYLDEKNVTTISPKERNVAMVFQNYSLFPRMNVFENIAFPLKIIHIESSAIKNKVHEISSLLNINNLLSRKPKELSGGEKQRVAIARAIIRNPCAFLFDEPFSNLDSNLKYSLRGEIIKIQQYLKTTTVYVTHDQIDALTMADRVVVMKNGTVMQIGKPAEVYNYPENLFVAGFMGIINKFRCRVNKNKKSISLILSNDKDSTNHMELCSFDDHSTYTKALEPFINNSIIAAIRPEDIHYCPPKIHNDAMTGTISDYNSNDRAESTEYSIFATCKNIEHKGYEALVTLNIGNQSGSNSIIMRAAPDNNIKLGNTISIYFDNNKMLLFNTDTGNRL